MTGDSLFGQPSLMLGEHGPDKEDGGLCFPLILLSRGEGAGGLLFPTISRTLGRLSHGNDDGDDDDGYDNVEVIRSTRKQKGPNFDPFSAPPFSDQVLPRDDYRENWRWRCGLRSNG